MTYPVFYPIEGDVLPILFDTFAGATGASVTMSGLAVTDIEIYKDGSVTQRASDAGYTLLDTDGIDFDSLTGIHGFSIDLSDNTDAGFYTVGPWYHVVVSAITIDSQTVSFIAAAFRIVSATRGLAGTALPAAAADAAGGLPISDAGGLDLDAKLAVATSALATPTNITAGTITTVTNLTNAPTAGDLTATMKASVNAEADTAIADAALATAANLSTVSTNVSTLLTRIPAALFSGITSLAQWLGLIAGKQTGDATARTELRATGAGSGTYDETTDSQEAIKDAGGGGLDAAGVRAAVGLAAANLDTQLGDIPTVAEFEARTLVAASYFDPAADTVANVTTVGSVTGSVGSVTGAINTAAGTITTLDALDTAQDTQHSTTQGRLPAALVGGRIDATVDATGMEAGAITAILTTAMTESYAADGVAPTLTQALFLIQQTLTEFVISGTTLTIKKIDGTTTAATLTLNDATTPTGATRAT